jgi:hypothetical protein
VSSSRRIRSASRGDAAACLAYRLRRFEDEDDSRAVVPLGSRAAASARQHATEWVVVAAESFMVVVVVGCCCCCFEDAMGFNWRLFLSWQEIMRGLVDPERGGARRRA